MLASGFLSQRLTGLKELSVTTGMEVQDLRSRGQNEVQTEEVGGLRETKFAINGKLFEMVQKGASHTRRKVTALIKVIRVPLSESDSFRSQTHTSNTTPSHI